MAFIKVAAKADIPVGEMKKFDINDVEVTVANVNGKFYAFEDRCPHMNAALHKGRLNGKDITCPFHKARFDIRSGKKFGDPHILIPRAIKMGSLMAEVRTHDLKRFNVKVTRNDVYVDL